jgi:hypothetical protein
VFERTVDWTVRQGIETATFRTGQVPHLLPFLEATLTGFGEQRPQVVAAMMSGERSIG